MPSNPSISILQLQQLKQQVNALSASDSAAVRNTLGRPKLPGVEALIAG